MIHRLPLFLLPLLLVFFAHAQETTVADEAIADPFSSELVQVDWVEEMMEGGITMVVLGILSVALVAFLIERFVTLRRQKFAPSALLAKARPLFHEGKFEDILALCDNYPSPAAEIIRHCVEYRESDFEFVQTTVGDIGARVVVDQEEKCNPLSVIAGVAPLLGLLGTMIGMIESFKLVEIFGDEGGASLLAGSISKALITTAVGLILAIPAVVGYHWSRRKVHNIATALELESESLLKFWFLSKQPASK
jgi:biopolymer transport protein ExbB